jgi:hypothetical protein
MLIYVFAVKSQKTTLKTFCKMADQPLDLSAFLTDLSPCEKRECGSNSWSDADPHLFSILEMLCSKINKSNDRREFWGRGFVR